MGKHLGCDVDWSLAPEGAVFYAEGYFRNEKGDWWSETWSRWFSPQYTLEELLQANDYEPKPEESEMEDTEWTRLVEDNDGNPYCANVPLGAVKFEGRKWWNSDGRFWDNVHEEWAKPCEEQEALNNLLKEATKIASNGGTFIQVVPLDPPKTSIQFLDEVKHIQSERAAEYEQDGGERSFAKISTVFNTYTGKDLAPSDIALILEILKNVRFYSQDGYHRDSVVDKISYGSLWAELVTEERE